MADIKKIGGKGEALAVEFLKQHNYRVIERNFRCKSGEIDIIAQDKDSFCFIEVKTRSTGQFGSGFDAITSSKQRKLVKAALWYCAMHDRAHVPMRFDIVAVQYSSSGSPCLELLKDAFDVSNHALNS